MPSQPTPATDSAAELHALIGDDATATFESNPTFIESNPTGSASSENLDGQRPGAGSEFRPELSAAPTGKGAGPDDDEEADEIEDDEDDDDEDDDLEDDDEDDLDEDDVDDDEDEDDEDYDDEDDEDDEDEDEEDDADEVKASASPVSAVL